MVYTVNAPINTFYKSNNVTNSSPFAQFEMKTVTSFQEGLNTRNTADTVVINKQKPITTANDGKFSIKVAVNNFFKGVFSPITSMFNSYKSFAVGMGTIALGAALCSAGFAPALIAVGIAVGSIQATTTLYQLITAKNGDDVEKACYGAGIATSTLGLSIYGAKGALGSVSQNTSNMSKYNAVKGCFKQTPKSFNRLFGAVKAKMFNNPFVKGANPVIQEHIARIESANEYYLAESTSMVKDPYKVIGVHKTASQGEIKTAYKSLAQLFHPDNQSTGNGEAFKAVSSAYSMLKSTVKKSVFDHAFAEQKVSLTPSALISQVFNRKD